MQQSWVFALSLGIPYIIIVTIWSIILKRYFKWRPFLFSSFVISNYIKQPKGTCKYILFITLWWAFFSLPFIIPIIYAGILHSKFQNVILDISVAIVPFVLTSLLFLYKNFKNNGFKVGFTSKLMVPLVLVLIIALNSVTSYLYKEDQWEAFGYLLMCPSLLVYAFALAISRARINYDTANDLITSEEARNEFSKDITDKKFNKWLVGSHKMKWWCLIVFIVLSAGFNAAFYGIFRNTETLMTAAASVCIDYLILIRQYFLKNQLQTMNLLIGAYIVKTIVISIGPKYWLFSHSLYLSIFGCFCLVRFLHWLFIMLSCGCNKKRIRSEKINDEIKERLEKVTPEGRRPSSLEALTSIISFILTAGLAALVLFKFADKSTEKIFDREQKVVYVMMLVFAIAVSLCLASLICAFNTRGRLNFVMLLSFLLGYGATIVFLLFYKEIHMEVIEVVVIFLIIFLITDGFIVLMLTFENGFNFKKGSHAVIRLYLFGFLLVADMISLIVLPIVKQKSVIGVTFVLGLLSVYSFFGFSHYFVTPTYKWDVQINFVLFVFFYGGFCGSFVGLKLTKVCYYLIVIGVVFVVYGFVFIWTYRNKFYFTKGPLILSLLSSAIFTGLSFALFLKTEYQMLGATLSELFLLVFCASLFFFAMTTNLWRFNWLSILSIVLFIALSIIEIYFIVKYNSDSYFVYTIISIVLGLLTISLTLMYTLINTETQVLVFTNFFFPCRRYTDGSLYKTRSFTISLSTFVFVVWFWGLMGLVHNKNNLFALVCMNGGFYLSIFFSIYLLLDLDKKCFFALNYISKSTILHALAKAMRAAGVGSDFTSEKCQNRTDLNELIKSEKINRHINSCLSHFISALKAQIYISSEMAFDICKQKLFNILKRDKNNDVTFLATKDFSPEHRNIICEIYLKLSGRSSVTLPENEYILSINSTVNKVNTKTQWKNVQKYIELKSEIKGMVDNLKNNTKYVDDDFHPTKRIEESIKLLDNCQWERAEKKFKGREFEKTCQPNEIVQGYFGDCYLVTSLSSICQNSRIIKNLFYKSELAVSNGVSCVSFNAMDTNLYVLVDTMIPVSKEGKPKMVSPLNENSPWWFCMVEKTFCKLVGSLSESEGGAPSNALYRLVGGYPMVIELNTLDVREKFKSGALFDQINEIFMNGGYLVSGSMEGNNSSVKHGIVQGHAYNILDVVDYRGIKLLKLRNPWGKTEWNGDWSDDSDLWDRYPAVKNRCKFEKADDGMFWISFNDFVDNYSSVYCLIPPNSLPRYRCIIKNKLKPGNLDGSKPVTNTPPADNLCQYIMRVHKSSKFMICLERTGPGIGTWVYAMKTNTPVKKISSGSKYRNEAVPLNVAVHSFEWTLEQGDWVFFVCRNKIDEPSDYVLSLYSNSSFEVTSLINGEGASIKMKTEKTN
ncbi:Clan CA, family C2, calpain-like cysteine peptidase [Trichomonas vaginalis G3]|uniref:Clan CA, family C2, calpain-like cysteine peptidase n=1 Tax=Trichomonas vaginalis (strain ATCC PRA-98 / G3) TaxID=412133 RepID=A2D9A8_TRIV3|nr:calcium-dependent cysteine-type endopeptidase protein [Trichomonas vaginalis G3]EAY23134.1 Clan CA, family C2, calpain-like cysteine peptidase [Trichomonas vaginalis G3]KAI5513799.1 calcium-dependent cysteine-type endopeptidase protein [Trichomonas vaginalis G3]|eukprot:XP_001584120.1 Clan CA, family C2, calpain-like cysteine peptidase [Trichomonas vaginalis G3]